MKTLDQVTLQENFEWTPSQLLAMIRRIDKICPEEGLLNIHDDTDHDTRINT
jgi:hypothetical protein